MGAITRYLFALLICMLLWGCEPSERKRPIGLMRLGLVEDFLDEPETHLPNFWLKIERDEGGLYAMSTLCGKELQPLLFFPNDTMSCPKCGSKFDPHGEKQSGPSPSLPYFKLGVGPGDTKEFDTLYVTIGEEVSRDWRLRIIDDEADPEAVIDPK